MSATMLSHDAKADIVDVLTRYATGIDRRDWSQFRSCFTEDCDADYGEIGHWHRADEITAWMEEAHREMGHTLHRLSNIVVTGHEQHATARCYVDVVLTVPNTMTGHHAIGFYDDELVATDTGWKIARRRFTMVFSETIGAA
jgi:3-phenylpropionate/cinnamic acid dioxygenase small subunit